MALRGNLRDFSLIQLLNLIHMARKTGGLTIAAPHETAMLFFRSGKLAYAACSSQEQGLAAVLLRAGKISAGQHRLLQTRASGLNDQELGLKLVNAGYLSQAAVLSSLQEQLAELVRYLYNWAEGEFQFTTDQPVPFGRIPVQLDLENLIIEGARHLQEWEQLRSEIPSMEMALKFPDRPRNGQRNINLSAADWQILSLVNPNNSLGKLARATNMSELEIRRVVYGLLQAGLVELTRPVEKPAARVARVLPDMKNEERRTIVQRLIQRIRSI